MKMLPNEVQDWIESIFQAHVERCAENHDWSTVDLSEHFEIDYSDLANEIDDDQLMSNIGDSITEDVDWSEVVRDQFEKWMDNNIRIEDAADHLEGDIDAIVNRKTQSLENRFGNLHQKWAETLIIKEEMITTMQAMIRTEIEKHNRPWWRFW